MSAETMKNSGIKWVGSIPHNWDVMPLKNLFAERKRKNWRNSETNLLSLSYGRIISKDINSLEGLLPESFNTYNIVERGDLIIRPTDLQNDQRSLRTGLVQDHGIITSAYIALRPIAPADSRFFHYLLHAYDVMKVFYNMGNGVRQGINYSEFSRLSVIKPSLSKQTEISNVLDTETSKIDRAVDLLRQQIETLEQLKKSVIHEAVTKGLDPSVRMKPSGVDWIGDVPEHWEIKRLKYLCKMQAGINLTSEDIDKVGIYPVYGGNGIRGYYSDFNSNHDRVLIGRQGALSGNVKIGRAPFWATDHAIVVVPNASADMGYLYFSCTAANLNRLSMTAAQPGLSVEKIIEAAVPVPPFSQQIETGRYLAKRDKSLSLAIKKKQDQVDILKRYKQSLIFEYVTGKRRVSEVA